MIFTPKKLIRKKALILKKLLEEQNPYYAIEIEYTKWDEKKVKKIFREVLGDEWSQHVIFKKRELEPHEKKVLLLIFGLSLFPLYLLGIFGAVIGSIFFGYSLEFVDLLIYIGNVGSLILGLYIIRSGIHSKSLFHLLLGLFVIFINLYSMGTYFERYHLF